MTVKLFGIEYPLSYTIEAELAIEDRFGGIIDRRKIEEVFDTTKFSTLTENVLFMTQTMISSGIKREAVRRRMMGQEAAKRSEIAYEDLKECITPGEVVMLMRKCVAAINEGNRIHVETLPEKGGKKKGETK